MEKGKEGKKEQERTNLKGFQASALVYSACLYLAIDWVSSGPWF